MSYASRSGQATTNPSSPRAFACCDRCSRWFNRVNLRWQYDWRGASLANLYFLVCRDCYDTPQQQLRAIVVPADPVPIVQPRVEPFLYDEMTGIGLSATTTDPVTGLPVRSQDVYATQGGSTITTQPIGMPVGLEQDAVMPLLGDVHYGVELDLLSVSSTGTDVITVTCRTAHGLATADQISAEGLSAITANGMYSVVVTTATAFTYQVNDVVGAGSFLTGTSRIVTALVGLPLGFTTIPLVGP